MSKEAEWSQEPSRERTDEYLESMKQVRSDGYLQTTAEDRKKSERLYGK